MLQFAMPRKSPYVSGDRVRLTPVWVQCACVTCSGYVRLRTRGKGQQPRYCVACIRRRRAAWMQEYGATHPDTRRERERTPYGKKRGSCSICGGTIWLGTGSRENPTCRECRRANPRVKPNRSVYSLKLPGISSAEQLIDWLLGENGYTCGLCRELVTEDQGLAGPSVGHVVPLARGGEHEAGNLRLEHLRCNIRKGARLDSELDWVRVLSCEVC